VYRVYFPGVKRPGRDAALSSPSGAVVRINGSLSVRLPYALRARAEMTLAAISGHYLGRNGMNREKNLILFVNFSACAV
jgi:hypothetical protein